MPRSPRKALRSERGTGVEHVEIGRGPRDAQEGRLERLATGFPQEGGEVKEHPDVLKPN